MQIKEQNILDQIKSNIDEAVFVRLQKRIATETRYACLLLSWGVEAYLEHYERNIDTCYQQRGIGGNPINIFIQRQHTTTQFIRQSIFRACTQLGYTNAD